MKLAVAAVVALAVAGLSGAFALIGATTPAGTDPEAPSPRGGIVEDFTDMPALAVSWRRVGPDVWTTFVTSDPPKPLDCRWGAIANLKDRPVNQEYIINLTDDWEGPGYCSVTDPALAFVDHDGDRMMTVGDYFVVRGVEAGRETELVLVVQYWASTQWYEFRWESSDLSI